nr:ATP synthase CF0 C subunit [Helleborus foetidus]WIW41478.1 ATP synthase CF0 C subunit [Helleborus foetidus]
MNLLIFVAFVIVVGLVVGLAFIGRGVGQGTAAG